MAFNPTAERSIGISFPERTKAVATLVLEKAAVIAPTLGRRKELSHSQINQLVTRAKLQDVAYRMIDALESPSRLVQALPQELANLISIFGTNK